MSYKALYRTYRPQTFEEVAGQEHIVKTLKNALATGKIAHAYLFAGPRGTGKTTMAKLFAKGLNCEEGIGHQCLECKNCKAILEGNHPDVVEVDAASNNGVEQVRELIENVRYSTILGRYKVYIIDEVHMMSASAFNALLKTLEEPPANVIFILATTEPYKIIPTILSRCQRYDFSKLSDEEIKGRLIEVMNSENIEYEEDAVKTIISLSDGGMRDALSILDQVLAYSSNKLLAKDVLDIFSLESLEEKLNLVNAVTENNVSLIIKKVREYIAKGTDINRLTTDLLNIFKDVLIYKSSKSASLLEQLKEENVKSYISLKENDLLSAIDILNDALQNYRFVSSSAALFEITLLKLANTFKAKTKTEQTPIIEEEKEKIPTFDTSSYVEKVKEEVKEQAPVTPEIAPLINNEEANLDKITIYPSKLESYGENNYQLNDEIVMNLLILSKKDLKQEYLDKWNLLKSYMAHPIYGRIASLLSDGHLLTASNDALLVEYDFSKQVEKVNNKENQKLIQLLTQLVFKKKLFVYGLSRNESIEQQNRFMNLRQIGKMPKRETININWIGEE